MDKRRRLIALRITALAGMMSFGPACSSLPAIKVDKHSFPRGAYVGVPDRPFETLGVVRTKVEYPSLNPDMEEAALCKNYYNKAVEDLLKRAHDRGGDAVAHVKSVVFLVDGRSELHDTPECSDDGSEGQVLAQGVAVKWKLPPKAGEKPAATRTKKNALAPRDPIDANPPGKNSPDMNPKAGDFRDPKKKKSAQPEDEDAADEAESRKQVSDGPARIMRPGDPAVLRGN